MFSLAFYPEFDAHHAAFRALCIGTKFRSFPVQTYRIVDYFYLNPFDLHTFRMTGVAHKKISAKFDHLRPYHRSTEPAAAALHMWQFEQSALTMLARRDFISAAALAADTVSFTPHQAIPDTLKEAMRDDLEAKSEVLDFLVGVVGRFPLSGKGGLKDRSGLLDFRYDVKSNAVAA